MSCPKFLVRFLLSGVLTLGFFNSEGSVLAATQSGKRRTAPTPPPPAPVAQVTGFDQKLGSFAQTYLALLRREMKITQGRISLMTDRMKYYGIQQTDGKVEVRGNLDLQRVVDERKFYQGHFEHVEELIADVQQKVSTGRGIGLAPSIYLGERRRADETTLKYFGRRDPGALACQLEDCAKSLGQFTELAGSLTEVNRHLLISRVQAALTKLDPQTANVTNLDDELELADATIAVENAFLDCRERNQSLYQDREVKADPLAQCFLAKIAAHEEKIAKPNMSVSVGLHLQGWYMVSEPQKSVDRPTGNEDKLKQWLASRTDYSVTPWDLFEQAYVINGGSMESALRTAMNAIRTERLYPKFQNKLIDIRGDRGRSEKKGDNVGDWYHVYATMFARHVYSKPTYGAMSWLHKVWDKEEGVGQKDKKEVVADQLGGDTMANLIALIEKRYKAKERPKLDPNEYCKVEKIFTIRTAPGASPAP